MSPYLLCLILLLPMAAMWGAACAFERWVYGLVDLNFVIPRETF